MRLTIITLTIALAALTACDPGPMTAVDGPSDPGKPACVGDVVVLDWFEDDTPCDLNPPQRLDQRMADLTNRSRTNCHNHGGTVTIDNTAGTAYCVNLDY